jgi:hypothetical protein
MRNRPYTLQAAANIIYGLQPRSGITSGTAFDSTTCPELDHYFDAYMGLNFNVYLPTSPFFGQFNKFEFSRKEWPATEQPEMPALRSCLPTPARDSAMMGPIPAAAVLEAV